ncbi:unnamed protein product [Medioppia subpectinata]|uniref:Metalloendopeptidase n=1 Tax=Medioppia subpectinata TaxID=1979941 RepID=A0A7R9PYT4_9ACAR|nr:unnamed protein product [Medioppia subpectinata]CAG2106220.1 unnamed protein product [Medioppia subpectinata]
MSNPFNMRFKRAKDKAKILDAMSDITKNNNCVQFKPRSNEADYVHIQPGTRCKSKVGRKGGKQYVDLAPGCINDKRKSTHELLHAVGFHHEHSRPDRDDYVEVQWANLKPGNEQNFQKYNQSMYQVYTKFDYGSIMLYKKTSMSNNKEFTLISKQAPTHDITYTKVMSPLDIVTTEDHHV